MTDAEHDVAQPDLPSAYDGGKRRGRTRRTHTIAKVLVCVVVVLGLLSGLSVAYFYRHLNGNLEVVPEITEPGAPRPTKVHVEGPKEPLNILIMGSDSRDGKGDNIDGLTGGGQRSDTTILMHLSADRKHAYGVSIPRDSMVDRPECKDASGNDYPASTYQMWNAAFGLAGPNCTVHQFETLTGIRVDDFVVVDFAGFRDMVDAVGGVEVCIPQTIDDSEHHIYLPAGTRDLKGREALAYVRVRHGVGDGSDVGRMKRQQAFIAAMVHRVLSSDVMANPWRVYKFLDAATKSLKVSKGLSNLVKIGKLGYEFKDIGLKHIQFLTIPSTTDPNDINRLVWTPQADVVWHKLLHDQTLPKKLAGVGTIKANHVPGQHPSGGSSSGGTSSAQDQALSSAGLCT